jgi:glycosyltransferase involved in cell wall biosynthesis
VLVDPLQVESIAAGIDRLLALTPAQRAAAQAWGEGFTWERCAAETIAVYRSAVAAA